MKKLLLLLAFAANLFALACTQNTKPAAQSDAQSTAPAQTAAVYACPMKCEGEKTYPQAGQCPVCGMDLEVVTASGAQPDSTQDQQHEHAH